MMLRRRTERTEQCLVTAARNFFVSELFRFGIARHG
jgi:hypothetical protein